MNTILKFKKSEVQRLVKHTLDNPEMMPTFSHATNKEYWTKDAVPMVIGKGRDKIEYVETKDIDVSKIQPYILLVKDRGIYLMSGSSKRDLDENTNGRSFVAYAEGFGPDADFDVLCHAVGGDDFSEALPLEWFVEMTTFKGEFVCLKFTGNSVVVLVPKDR